MKLKSLLKNFSYTILSNFISLAISTLVVLIVPKFINIEQYGYLQLYIFYTTYVGVLHFGWLDGIYLRFGGARYDELDTNLLHSQFVQFFVFQILLATIMISASILESSDQKFFILVASVCAMILINLRQFCLYILQDTARIKEYAIVTSLGRVIYFSMVILFLLLGLKCFQWLILADLLGRTISLLYSLYTCKEIVCKSINSFHWDFHETVLNLSVGVKLLMANFASSLIIGIVRYGIQFRWGVKTFGKVSLTLNISNLLMTFISAVSLVLYPALRRMNTARLRDIYVAIREVLIFSMLVGLILYYPVSWLLPMWLPKYKDALVYMALLFPMCVYSSKFSMLVATFMKAYRFERDLLKVNIVSLVSSVIITAINVFILRNLTMTMISIVVVLWIQSSIGELVLGRRIHLKLFHKLLPETIIVMAFMVLNSFLPSLFAMFVYIVVLLLFLITNYQNIKAGVHVLSEQ